MKRKNINCMLGLRCPKCGQDDELIVWAEVPVSLVDDGTDPHADSIKGLGGPEWTEESITLCPECRWQSVMRDFCIKRRPL